MAKYPIAANQSAARAGAVDRHGVRHPLLTARRHRAATILSCSFLRLVLQKRSFGLRLLGIRGDIVEGHDAPIRRWSSGYLHGPPCGSRKLSHCWVDARSRRRSHVPCQKSSRRVRACRNRNPSGQIGGLFAGGENSKAALSPTRNYTPYAAGTPRVSYRSPSRSRFLRPIGFVSILRGENRNTSLKPWGAQCSQSRT
jgi:hypothetical protein